MNILGTKMRCPFCERTYGYETNLRAHIRQRHQGIRVSCPYCPRTFTRNNTVRRHVQVSLKWSLRLCRNWGFRIPEPNFFRALDPFFILSIHAIYFQREHRNFGDRLPTKFSPTRILPDPIHTMAAAVTIASMSHPDNKERPKK